MIFEDIFLLPDELDLLRNMLDEKPRDRTIPGVMSLRDYELVSMVEHRFPDKILTIVYSINDDGKRYLRYLDRKQIEKAKSSRKDSTRFWINLAINIVILLLTASALVVSIFALLNSQKPQQVSQSISKTEFYNADLPAHSLLKS